MLCRLISNLSTALVFKLELNVTVKIRFSLNLMHGNGEFVWFYGIRKTFIIWVLAQILQNWKIENVDNFVITTV